MNALPRSAGPFILLCTGLALLYSIGLFSRSIWFDEAITLQSLATVPFRGLDSGLYAIADLKIYLAGTTTIPALIDHYITTDVHPPLYFLIAHIATLMFGNDLIVVRAVSLLLVLASVAVFTRTLQRTGTADGWVFALVYGLSFTAVSTAQDARGYALVLLLAVLAWRMLTDLPETRGGRRVAREVLLGLVCAGLLLTHYFSVLLVAGLLGWHLVEAMVRRTPLALIAPVVCTLVFLPWLPVLFHHLGARPDSFVGFNGLLDWAKRAATLIPAQVFSASHHAVPGEIQKLGRVLVLGLMVLGAVAILRRPGNTPQQARFALIAVFVPLIGLTAFLGVSILLDRWFDTLRYFLFYAPFAAYLAARGTLVTGRILAGPDRRALRLLPAAVLILSQSAMVNYGWETNRNRGGAYFLSISDTVRAVGTDETLVVVDVGSGRGTVLAATQTLPPDARAYLLDPDPEAWVEAAADITAMLEDLRQVVLVFTIERGSMEADKAALYGPVTKALESNGFTRAPVMPPGQGQRYYARWVK